MAQTGDALAEGLSAARTVDQWNGEFRGSRIVAWRRQYGITSIRLAKITTAHLPGKTPMPEENNLIEMTIEIVASYVAHNNIRPEDVPDFIAKTHAAITGIAREPEALAETAPPAEAEYTPAVTVRKSLASRDHILSLIDGKPYKALKRHLGTHGLTPADYRARYGLKADYPMVAPGYSEQRREVAKRLGLGRKSQKPAATAEAQQPAPEVVAPVQPKLRRGPKPKAVDAPAVVSKAPRRRKGQAAAAPSDNG